MRTFSPRAADISRRWLVIDAEGAILGRMSTEIATLLRGKHKPIYAPHVDTGDHVIVINASKLAIDPKKATDKLYHRHTGYPGGIRTESLEHLLARDPERVVRLAVRRMLPKGPLGRQMLKKLKIYGGDSHPHHAQQPADYPAAGARPGAHRRLTQLKGRSLPKPLIQTTGRRKEAVARVRVRNGTGKITVNGRPFATYFPILTHQVIAKEPLRLTQTEEVYDVEATLDGGGVSGQAGAIRLGIARALIALDPDTRPALKKAGLLARDAREKERRKYGLKKARKAPQYSKR